MREKFHQKLVTLHKRRKRIEDRNRDPARKFPTIVQTNLIFPFFERFQGCYFSPPLPHFVSVCGVREKEKEVSRTSVYYHLRMPSSPNTFSTAIFPYFFLPVAMFVFAIANIKTARARHSTISLSSRRGNAPISYSRDIIPHRWSRFLWEPGRIRYFPGKWRNAYRFEIGGESPFYGDYCFFISRSGKLLDSRARLAIYVACSFVGYFVIHAFSFAEIYSEKIKKKKEKRRRKGKKGITNNKHRSPKTI